VSQVNRSPPPDLTPVNVQIAGRVGLTQRYPRAFRFNNEHLVDTTPLPDSIPKVKELGASSAPLLSASFFIGARCRDYNDDYMKCKTDNPGRGEFECLQEGRRVTRCARSVYVELGLCFHH
jgi:hypothetical protein